MLLTIPQPTPTKPEFGARQLIHDFPPRPPPPFPKPRWSPRPVDSPINSTLRVSVTAAADDNNNIIINNNNNNSSNSNSNNIHQQPLSMSTPHRGLPPPASLNLPDPRGPPPSGGGGSNPLGAIPQPPSQWQGQEESMRHWLVAKAEEDRRRAEEERTRQEGFRLEQRKIEQAMLRESLQAGVPPALVPVIYASIGGAANAGGWEWLREYAQQQMYQSQQQGVVGSPEVFRRETRLLGPAATGYAQGAPPAQQPTAPPPSQTGIPGQPPLPADQQQQQQPPPTGHLHSTFSTYRTPPTSAPRSATHHTQLPRLTTNEMFIHQPAPPHPPGGGGGGGGGGSSSSAHPVDSSPSIYFHHWVPPSTDGSNIKNPQTPASRGVGEPASAHPSHVSSTEEYRESPRKRKAAGGHERNPPPSTSQRGVGSGHGRSRSGAMSPPREGSRPGSRGRAEEEQQQQQRKAAATSSPPRRSMSRGGEEPPPPPS